MYTQIEKESYYDIIISHITYCTYFTASIGQLKMLTIIQTLLFVLLGSLNCFLESLIQEVNRGDMFSFVK